MKLIDLKYGKLTLQTDGDKYYTKVRYDGVLLSELINTLKVIHEVSYSVEYSHNYSIKWSDDFLVIYYDYLTEVSNLKKLYPCLSPLLVTHIFEILIKSHWDKYIKSGKHICALLFLKDLLNKTLDFQVSKSIHVHKGTLYGFIAFTYLSMGDSYSGFSYLHCSIEDDIELNKSCSSFNYPQEAPCYKTLSLNDTINNFMQPFVVKVKQYLISIMKPFLNDYDDFKIDDLFNIFLYNDDFRYVKTYFVYSIWSIYDNSKKYEFKKLDNIFYQLSNLSSLLSLSFVIDNVLQYYDNLKGNIYTNTGYVMFGDRVRNFIKISAIDVADIDYYTKLKKTCDNQNLDYAIDELLKDELDLGKKKLKYLLISLLLRNKSAHEIDIHEIAKADYFDKILTAQLYSLLTIFRFYK